MTTRITDEEYPVEYDVPVIVRGADWIGVAFQQTEDDAITPIDTTGYTAQFIIYASENGEVYKTLAIGTGITMTAAQGLFNITMTATDVGTLDFKTAMYKFIVTDDSGGIICYFMGRVRVTG